jgi:hypothetical protein
MTSQSTQGFTFFASFFAGLKMAPKRRNIVYFVTSYLRKLLTVTKITSIILFTKDWTIKWYILYLGLRTNYYRIRFHLKCDLSRKCENVSMISHFFTWCFHFVAIPFSSDRYGSNFYQMSKIVIRWDVQKKMLMLQPVF